MPYGNDEWLEKSNREFLQAQVRQAKKHNNMLCEYLKEKFKVPDEFIDLALEIWWDGKED